MVNRSFAEFDRSRSCHSGMFSKAVLIWLRSSFDKDDMRSLLIGFRFTGTALLPICPALKCSATSPISVLCKFRISIAIFSNVEPKSARWKMYSAYLSLGITCVATSAGYSASLFATLFCIPTAFAPIREPVPTTPSVLQIRILFLTSSSLSMWAAISAAQFANFSPNEMMLACWPWVLPTAGTSPYCVAFFARISPRRATFGSIMDNTSLIWSELLVSTKSLLVRP